MPMSLPLSEALTWFWEISIGKDMKFSEEFETRFAEMLTHYPTKRSALVPPLLYAQDETGALTDEVIAELAQRLGLTGLEVRNVISYYSMLTTKPRGKYNVQVCTNIACMLRGGEELLDHCKKKLGSATRARPKTVCSRWKKWNVSVHAAGRQRYR